MTAIDKGEVVRLALESQLSPNAMERSCRALIEQRRAALQARLRKCESQNAGILTEQVRERARNMDRGKDFIAAFHGIAGEVFHDIAALLRGNTQSSNTGIILRLLQTQPIRSLGNQVLKVPDDFDIRTEIRHMVIRNIAEIGMDAYERAYGITIEDTDGRIFMEVVQDIDTALQAKKL